MVGSIAFLPCLTLQYVKKVYLLVVGNHRLPCVFRQRPQVLTTNEERDKCGHNPTEHQVQPLRGPKDDEKEHEPKPEKVKLLTAKEPNED